MQPPYPIKSKESPRDILAADFKSLRGGLPIRGGWGYTQADACIIDKNDPLVDLSLPFDGVGIEYIFVEKRIYEEMIIFPPDGEKFSGIKWNLLEQKLIQDAERRFDQLIFEITAFKDNDWEELKSEFEGSLGFDHPDFNIEAHEKKRQEKMVRLIREFWFDITSFYGQRLVITDKLTSQKKLLSPDSFKFTDKFKKLFWMSKSKMTVDYCASLYAHAIKEDIAVYKEAIKNHVAENVTKEQIDALEPELWALDLAVLDVVLFLSKFPPEMSKKVIPMLVVGYSPLEKDIYIKRSHYYGRTLESSPSEQISIELGKAFVTISGIKYQSERTNINEKALEWAIGTVVTGSLHGLGKFTADILKKYTIY